MQKMFAFVGQIPPDAAIPDPWDNLDIDEGIRQAGKIMGISPKVIRGKDDLTKYRNEKQAASQQQTDMDQAEQGANIVSKALPAIQGADPAMVGKMVEAAGRAGVA
jgi:hypothetical protein